MQLSISCVGKMKAGPERELLERYTERLHNSGGSVGLSWGAVREIPESRASNAHARKTEEASSLLSTLKHSNSCVIALDENGRDLSSEDWANLIGSERDRGRPGCTLFIGGADGHGDELLKRADYKLRFGKQTMPHQIVRILAAEQLYRVCTILAGHPYHRS
ncbi:MAG: 23S rRNA (pseudouridine(1915)-N(3))-methyltransferase RlmH [Pseudomonadota bacterium]